MKTIRSIFEGIFDTNDQKVTDAAIAAMVSDPDSDFSRSFYREKTTGTYQDGVLTLIRPRDIYQCKINVDYPVTTHIPGIKCITSKFRIELMSLSDRYAPLIDGHKLAPKISAPIMAWARRIRNITLEASRIIDPFFLGYNADIEIRGLEEAENVTFKTKQLFLIHLVHMPIFKSIHANNIEHIQFDFATVKDLERTFLPDIIDWEGTIDALGARSAKIPPYDLGKLYKRMGGNRVSYIFTNSMRFRSDLDPTKCIKGLPLPNLESISIDFNGIQLTITKNITGVTNPIPDSKWGYALT